MVGALWADLSELHKFLDRASSVRRTTRAAGEAELERLLRGAEITVTTRITEIDHRSLLESARVHSVMTVDQLVARMTTRFAMVTAFVVAVAARWDDLVPRLEFMGDAVARCGETGIISTSETAALRTKVQSVAAVVATDPLSVDIRALHDLEVVVATFDRSVSAAVELRDHLDERAAEVAEAIAMLRRDSASTRAGGRSRGPTRRGCGRGATGSGRRCPRAHARRPGERGWVGLVA